MSSLCRRVCTATFTYLLQYTPLPRSRRPLPAAAPASAPRPPPRARRAPSSLGDPPAPPPEKKKPSPTRPRPQATSDPKLRLLMTSMAECVRTIAFKVRTASCSGTACINTFGDEQLAVDVLADKLLFETLKYSGALRRSRRPAEALRAEARGEGTSAPDAARAQECARPPALRRCRSPWTWAARASGAPRAPPAQQPPQPARRPAAPP